MIFCFFFLQEGEKQSPNNFWQAAESSCILSKHAKVFVQVEAQNMPLRFTSLNLKGLFQFSGEFASNEISGPAGFFCESEDSRNVQFSRLFEAFLCDLFRSKRRRCYEGGGGGGRKRM